MHRVQPLATISLIAVLVREGVPRDRPACELPVELLADRRAPDEVHAKARALLRTRARRAHRQAEHRRAHLLEVRALALLTHTRTRCSGTLHFFLLLLHNCAITERLGILLVFA